MKLALSSLILFTGTALLAQEPAKDDHPLADRRQELLQATNGENAAPPAAAPDAAPPPPDASAQPPSAPAPAAPAEQSLGDAIPQAYRPDRYQATWEKNPFLIKMPDVVNPQASFAEDWELKFLSERNGTVRAGIQNRKTQEFRRITTEPDGEGFQLVTAKIATNRKDSEAEISKGSEKATFKYSETAAPPAAAPRPGVVPGQPGALPGGVPGAAQRPGMTPASNYRVPGAQPGAVPGNPMQQRAGVLPQQPGMAPGGAVPVPGAAPSPMSRRRVLIPAPASPTQPVP